MCHDKPAIKWVKPCWRCSWPGPYKIIGLGVTPADAYNSAKDRARTMAALYGNKDIPGVDWRPGHDHRY